MMAAGLISLRKLSPSMCLQHLGKFCPNCINCFQAQKAMVGETAASTMKVRSSEGSSWNSTSTWVKIFNFC